MRGNAIFRDVDTSTSFSHLLRLVHTCIYEGCLNESLINGVSVVSLVPWGFIEWLWLSWGGNIITPSRLWGWIGTLLYGIKYVIYSGARIESEMG